MPSRDSLPTARLSLGVAVALVLATYLGCYMALRISHRITHYEHVTLDGFHAVESDNAMLNATFYPLRTAEVLLRRILHGLR